MQDHNKVQQLKPIANSQQEEKSMESTASFKAPEYSNSGDYPPQPPVQRKPNDTGMPDDLKESMESLSGIDLSDVKVHTNSSKPAQLQAAAYAQGSDIHLGSGQEKHLPHEAWHVVQQKQGRVNADTQFKGANINTDKALETEADKMGQEATQLSKQGNQISSQSITNGHNGPVQLKSVPAKGKKTVQRNVTPESFVRQGLYGPQTIIPTTGIGGFEAMYMPLFGSNGMMIAYITTNVNFRNGLAIDAANRVTDNTGGDLSSAVSDIMAMPAANRAAAVSRFQWTAEQQVTQQALFETRMTEAMSNWSTSSHGKKFFIDKPDWTHLEASLTCVPKVNSSSTGKENIKTDLWKVPDDNSYTAGASIGTKNANTGRGNSMSIDTTHTNMTSTSTFLNRKVYFGNGSSRLSARAKKQLRNFVMLFQDSNTNKVSNKIKLVGRASSTGNAKLNKRLARKRMQAVKTEMMKNVTGPLSGANFPGFAEERVEVSNEGSTGAGADASWRRVDIIVGSGEVQNTIQHELGHVFGLDDEYVSDNRERVLAGGTGGVTGAASGHDPSRDPTFANTGADPSTYEMNDSIMSVGNEVRSQHLVTFIAALRQLTNVPEWKIKP